MFMFFMTNMLIMIIFVFYMTNMLIMIIFVFYTTNVLIMIIFAFYMTNMLIMISTVIICIGCMATNFFCSFNIMDSSFLSVAFFIILLYNSLGESHVKDSPIEFSGYVINLRIIWFWKTQVKTNTFLLTCLPFSLDNNTATAINLKLHIFLHKFRKIHYKIMGSRVLCPCRIRYNIFNNRRACHRSYYSIPWSTSNVGH
uniref:Transmembrane protein n=1 Tax=Medicago truncatula TaxID=3880 RepID=I3SF51_MEDTR|nr:unknown [Medicago truncatula]